MAGGFWETCLTGGLEAWSKACAAAGDSAGAAPKNNAPPVCPQRRADLALPARN